MTVELDHPDSGSSADTERLFLVMSYIKWDDVALNNGVPIRDEQGSIGFARIFASREAAMKAAEDETPPAGIQEVRRAVL